MNLKTRRKLKKLRVYKRFSKGQRTSAISEDLRKHKIGRKRNGTLQMFYKEYGVKPNVKVECKDCGKAFEVPIGSLATCPDSNGWVCPKCCLSVCKRCDYEDIF